MTARAGHSDRGWLRAGAAVPTRSHAVRLVQVFAVAVMVVPSDTVLKPIGAAGYLAGLVGMVAFAAWGAATLLRIHDPLRHRHPMRTLLWLMWMTTLVSFVLIDRASQTVEQGASADRYVMQLATMSGAILLAAEGLRSLDDVRRVLRALSWGGAVCGVVAALQFWLRLDIAPYFRMLPGFSLNTDNASIMAREALNRVAGTAIHPIELGTTAGMLLPLALWLALTDTERSPRRRWLPVLLIAIAIPTSVSRSAILAVALALTPLVILMPVRQRLGALMALPFALVGVFMSAPGVISTLVDFFRMGTNDPSVATRVDDYPLVERLVREAPWFGHGGGTYLPANAFDILDNQYLKTMIELGLVGWVVMSAFFLWPFITALLARDRAADPDVRLLCAALAGTALSATASAATFDALSFPMFANVHALALGLIGCAWRLSAAPAPVPARLHLIARAAPHGGLHPRPVQPAGG